MRKNPYTDLRDDCLKWARTVMFPAKRGMWSYPAARLQEGWGLLGLKERVAAADQLGWDVRLRVNDVGDLVAEYVKRHEPPPWAIRPG